MRVNKGQESNHTNMEGKQFKLNMFGDDVTNNILEHLNKLNSEYPKLGDFGSPLNSKLRKLGKVPKRSWRPMNKTQVIDMVKLPLRPLTEKKLQKQDRVVRMVKSPIKPSTTDKLRKQSQIINMVKLPLNAKNLDLTSTNEKDCSF